MPFHASSFQSRLLDHQDPQIPAPSTKLFTFLTNPPSASSKPSSLPLVSPKTIPPHTSTSWWRPSKPVYEADSLSGVEVQDMRGRDGIVVEGGLLAQDLDRRDHRAVVPVEYGENWSQRGKALKKIKGVLEMVGLCALVVFLVVLVLWAVSS